MTYLSYLFTMRPPSFASQVVFVYYKMCYNINIRSVREASMECTQIMHAYYLMLSLMCAQLIR